MKKLYSDPDIKISRFITENVIVTSGVVDGKPVDSVPADYGSTSVSFNAFGFVFGR